MLNQLRNLQVDGLDLEEIAFFRALAAAMAGVYDENEIDPPAWLKENSDYLQRELETRRTDELERRLKAAEARVEMLKPKAQQRKDAEAEAAALRQALGK